MSLPLQTRGARWATATAAVVLLAAVVLQAMPWMRPVAPSVAPRLAQRISARPGGWSSKEIPLGPSEFMANEVEKVLNYDEVINREYQRGGERFGVYVAYWGRGKMPTQLVASHTPDRCWTENGWHCLDMRFRQTAVFAGAGLPPVEWRIFEPPLGGETTYVLYWHLVDGEAYDYGERFNAVPDPVRWWRGAMRQALRGNGEQYFVRLTSDRPLESLWSDPGFQEIVRSLATLGAPPASARLAVR